jgi:hypothetical protein
MVAKGCANEVVNIDDVIKKKWLIKSIFT